MPAIAGHWTGGGGATYNPDRKTALDILTISHDLSAVQADIERRTGARAKVVVTTARDREDAVSFEAMGERLQSGIPHLLTFGTAWGLSDHFMEASDVVLAPIKGPAAYNHLSVRSATAIILDRLTGRS